MSELVLETARPFLPLLGDFRYKGAYGGRASGKSHFFAESAVEQAIQYPGIRGVCIREVQKSLNESAKLLIEDKIRKLGVGSLFSIQYDRIRTPGDGLIIFRGMQDYNAETIKSLEGFDWAWNEEAQTTSQRSLELLRPTIRGSGRKKSELWFSWNPRNPEDPVDKFFRGNGPPPDSRCVRCNWDENPYFPPEMEVERQFDYETNHVRYAHIWEGEYEPVALGAIWDLATINEHRRTEAPIMNRILVAVDPAISNENDSDEHGIIVGGEGEDKRGYILEDASMKGTPRQWATRVVQMYDKWEADAVVVERNQGGDMVKHTLQTVRPELRVVEVVATRGKHVRAEPIAALYGAGKISHVGTFQRLEFQMCQMTAAGFEGNGSPDRVDALVWCMTDIFPAMIAKRRRELHVPENHISRCLV